MLQTLQPASSTASSSALGDITAGVGGVKDCRLRPTERALRAAQAEPRTTQGQRSGLWSRHQEEGGGKPNHPARVRAACRGRGVSRVSLTC